MTFDITSTKIWFYNAMHLKNVNVKFCTVILHYLYYNYMNSCLIYGLTSQLVFFWDVACLPLHLFLPWIECMKMAYDSHIIHTYMAPFKLSSHLRCFSLLPGIITKGVVVVLSMRIWRDGCTSSWTRAVCRLIAFSKLCAVSFYNMMQKLR